MVPQVAGALREDDRKLGCLATMGTSTEAG
jgi:hypothetical protein